MGRPDSLFALAVTLLINILAILLEEAGFRDIRFERVGRIPPLAKAMIAVARKP